MSMRKSSSMSVTHTIPKVPRRLVGNGRYARLRRAMPGAVTMLPRGARRPARLLTILVGCGVQCKPSRLREETVWGQVGGGGHGVWEGSVAKGVHHFLLTAI